MSGDGLFMLDTGYSILDGSIDPSHKESFDVSKGLSYTWYCSYTVPGHAIGVFGHTGGRGEVSMDAGSAS